jgi:hypothetical protein
MKGLNKIFIISAFASLFFGTSCEKNQEAGGVDSNIAEQTIGTYSGNLINSASGLSQPATLTVNAKNDSVITMHCVANGFDTTVTLRLYENNDKISVCYTGDDFREKYGHHLDNNDFSHSKPEGWNNNWCHDHNCWSNGDEWNAWTNHLNTQHNQNDAHFGDFNLKDKTCSYKFLLGSNKAEFYETFNGVID